MTERVLIVDDERLARVRIRTFLEAAFPQISIAEAADGFDALEKIPRFLPDLVFLDIEMPEISGLDVLHHLERRPFHVVFQTAYDAFAVKAFEENACDYLLKPFSDDRLRKAVEKAAGDPPGLLATARLDRTLVRGRRFMERLVVSIGRERSKMIDSRDVVAFASEDHVTQVVLEKMSYTYDYSLSYLEERLNPEAFVRVHRNAIVKLDAVATLLNGPQPGVALKNGATYKVARDRVKALRERLGA